MIEVQNNSVPLGLPNQVFVTESPSPKSYIILHVHRQLTKIPKIQSNIDAHQKPSMKSSKHYNISSSVPYGFSPPNPQGHLKKHSQPTASRSCWLRICRFHPAAWTSYGRGRGATPVLWRSKMARSNTPRFGVWSLEVFMLNTHTYTYLPT
jgi:hypothetical protein